MCHKCNYLSMCPFLSYLDSSRFVNPGRHATLNLGWQPMDQGLKPQTGIGTYLLIYLPALCREKWGFRVLLMTSDLHTLYWLKVDAYVCSMYSWALLGPLASEFWIIDKIVYDGYWSLSKCADNFILLKLSSMSFSLWALLWPCNPCFISSTGVFFPFFFF